MLSLLAHEPCSESMIKSLHFSKFTKGIGKLVTRKKDKNMQPKQSCSGLLPFKWFVYSLSSPWLSFADALLLSAF